MTTDADVIITTALIPNRPAPVLVKKETVALMRRGSVIGHHDVVFAGEGESIVLGHRAETRDIFARGALKAAKWAHGHGPGLFSMQDVLGLGETSKS